LDFAKRQTSEEDTQALEDLAQCAETELRLAGYLEVERQLLSEMDELKRKASVDPITRCWNEQTGLEILERLKDSASVHSEVGMVVLLISLPNLPELNDQLGSQATDLYLREVASRLRTNLPKHSCLSRAKSATFLAVVPDVKAGLCEELGRALIQRVNGTVVNLEKLSIPAQLCAGLTIFGRTAQPVQGILDKANRALTRAKKLGAGAVHVTI
jgi:diguanylate cyclase (GGDEF)-like protein